MSNIVCIDYAHGIRQYTKGKQSPDGSLYEGEWSREVGKRLKKELELLGFRVFEVTPENEDIALQKRCERVNEVIAKNPHDNIILISIHINASPLEGWDDKASGESVFVCTNASEASVKLGQYFYEGVIKMNLKGNRCVPSERVWRANYKILRGVDCPAILTENLFMTNHNEVKYLLSEKGKESIVGLHVCAVCKYFGVPCSLIQA